MAKHTQAPDGLQWNDLLRRAVNEPGTLSTAYSAFHRYSMGNRLLALFQCWDRDITPSPLGTYKAWQEKGRQVRKGEKAMVLCQPVTFKTEQQERSPETGELTGESEEVTRQAFCYPARWFVLSQTDGDNVPPEPVPGWDESQALAALEIERREFAHPDGNCQGYASDRGFAVSALAGNPHKTTFHEMGHIVLGHTAEGQLQDGPRTPKNAREMEAEAVALLCVATLDLPGAEDARGYIQNWWGLGHDIPDRSAQRIFSAADKILKAGQGRI